MGIIVLIGVMFTFNTLIFNLVIAAITLIAVHEIYTLSLHDALPIFSLSCRHWKIRRVPPA